LVNIQSSVRWDRNGATFTDQQYSRGHRWLFDGGVEVPASSSPQLIPLPLSVEAAVDPEEAFVASLSSCHMLWFLAIAAKRGFVLDSYADDAEGVMAEGGDGKMRVTRVTLRPDSKCVGERQPDSDELLSMHRAAHDQCFIARSVTSEVRCFPVGVSCLADDHTPGELA